jgi:hypothetical protein
MTHPKPSNRNTIMNSLIRGIPRYTFDGKTITRITKTGKAKP